jgi:hypothetical protein
VSVAVNPCVAPVPVPVAPEIAPVWSYHCQLKDPVPPVTVAVKVAVCMLSTDSEDGSTENEGAGSTVTWSVGDCAVVEAVSVTA